eukprot:CAMPEP_0172514072 /NCGR_PEP_ID=MMETSP1066-20121228/257379_1 /TAXON_ID=671091 /ORGANISM="Coscinodiscus wailesii, Strain CCMP2513" /LENGTH=207 /DNA_ID=CAMNT_0013294595 /DNA_START=111 /DNA_END=734 /DNA_ORIENTATION=-
MSSIKNKPTLNNNRIDDDTHIGSELYCFRTPTPKSGTHVICRESFYGTIRHQDHLLSLSSSSSIEGNSNNMCSNNYSFTVLDELLGNDERSDFFLAVPSDGDTKANCDYYYDWNEQRGEDNVLAKRPRTYLCDDDDDDSSRYTTRSGHCSLRPRGAMLHMTDAYSVPSNKKNMEKVMSHKKIYAKRHLEGAAHSSKVEVVPFMNPSA